MAFQSVHHLLGLLENQAAWQNRQQFQRLLQAWGEIVGAAIAAQTRPVALQRQVLQVATSSSVWSQNLAFGRVQILEKLNAQLKLALVDIRFSPAQWHSIPPIEAIAPAVLLLQEHPSRLGESDPEATLPPAAASDCPAAFSSWAAVMQQRSRHLPLCPTCQCPTPAGELQRWSLCAYCVVKQW